MRATTGELRKSLRSSIAVSTAPYGYTLTVWASGAVGIELLGKPKLDDALLFMAGAVLAFLLLEAYAYGSIALRVLSGPPPTVTIWGSAHWLSAGIAIFAVWAAAHLVHGPGGWLLVGWLATSVYLLLNAVGVTVAKSAGTDETVGMPSASD